MCTHSLLAHSASGYLLQCKECSHFQFAFGTTELIMDREELDQFIHRLSSCQYDVNDPGALHRKTVRIALVNAKAALALSPFEAKELIDLLNEGIATLEVNKLLFELQ